MRAQQFHLPWPVSDNENWKRTRSGMCLNKTAVKFRHDVWALMHEQGVEKYKGRIHLDVLLIGASNHDYDIKNFAGKALIDALEHGGAFVNDSQIDDLHVARGHVEPPGAAIVTISEI